MAVTVKKLDGPDLPEVLRDGGDAQAFEIVDDNGDSHYIRGEEEAAKLAVELSERARK